LEQKGIAMRLPLLKPGRRSAAATVEFAVVAPVLFAVVLGVIEFGRAMMVMELLNNAARTGARAGVLAGSSDSDVQTAVDGVMTGTGVSGYHYTVKVNGNTANANTATTGDSISVTVYVSADSVSWLPVSKFLGGSNLTSTAVMRRE
jgi:Flp pilus assembly protein TadG